MSLKQRAWRGTKVGTIWFLIGVVAALGEEGDLIAWLTSDPANALLLVGVGVAVVVSAAVVRAATVMVPRPAPVVGGVALLVAAGLSVPYPGLWIPDVAEPSGGRALAWMGIMLALALALVAASLALQAAWGALVQQIQERFGVVIRGEFADSHPVFLDTVVAIGLIGIYVLTELVRGMVGAAAKGGSLLGGPDILPVFMILLVWEFLLVSMVSEAWRE